MYVCAYGVGERETVREREGVGEKVGTCGSQKALDPLEMTLQASVNCLTDVGVAN